MRETCSSRFSKILVFVIAFLLAASILASVEAQLSYRVFWDDFEDYEVKEYGGGAGPGPWVQRIGGGGTAIYRVESSGGNKFYSIESTGGVFVKAVLGNYFCFFGACIYLGPSNYDIYAKIKVADGEGGLIFRVTSDYKKYYLATVYKSPKKLILWYVNEDEGPGAGPKLAEVNLPADVDPSDWFTMRVWVYENNLTVFVNNKKLVSLLDNRIGYGSIGFYTFNGGKAYFDSFAIYVLYPEEATITKTITATTTKTATSTVTSTTTVAGTAPTATITTTVTQVTTETVTTAAGASTVTAAITESFTETITQTATQTVTEMRTVTERTRVAPPPKTETVTTTVTQPGGLRCLIATAAFGSEIAPQVQALREFRDGFVMKTFAGSSFMTAFNAFYYSWSPYIARAEYENPALRSAIRAAIYPLLYSLEISRAASTPFSASPELAVLVAGLVASSLIGLIYFAPIALPIYLVLSWRKMNLRIGSKYLAASFGFSILLFLVAEAFASQPLMIVASSGIVLSTIAMTVFSSVWAASILKEPILRVAGKQ